MRKLLIAPILALLLFTPALAQPARVQAADLILELYEEAGPGLGCLLFEPDIFLTLSGHKTQSRWIENVVTQADAPTVEKLNRALEKHGSRLVIDDEYFYAQSLVGLEESIARSGLTWLIPFDKASGWEGLEAWRIEQRNQLDDESLEVLSFMQGLPDSAVRGRGIDKDLIDFDMRISTDLPYSRVLMGSGVNFFMSPKYAADPDVLEVTRRLGEELRTFYLHDQVRQVIRTPEFLNARKERRPDLESDDRSEKWLRGDYDMWSVFEVSSTTGVTVERERVLIENIDELEKRIRAGDTPPEWARWLSQQNSRLDNAPLTGSDIRAWIWKGGYSRAPAARKRLYDVIKEVAPGYIDQLAGNYLEDWLEDDGSWDKRTYVLLSHPDIKTHFAGLGPSEKARVREILSRSEHVLVRALAQDSPYAQ
jgi:hypothetical protein